MDPTRVDGFSIETHPGLPEPWPAIARAYLVETYARGGSRRTAIEYARILSRFFETIDDPGRPGPLSIRAFAFAPVAGSLPPAASTVGVRLAALGGFYGLAVQTGLIPRNPVSGIRRPRPASPPPRGLSVSDLRRLLAAIPGDASGRRDRAVVVLILLTGLRREEALSLRFEDLDLASGTFVIRVKGGAIRRRFLPPPARAALEAWQVEDRRQERGPSPDGRLFGFGPEAFYASLRRRASAAGIEGCTPHALRHSAAQLRRRTGASIEEVSAILGHESIATTARYLRRLEPERDDGWPAAAAALGIGEPARPIRQMTGKPRIRAGPLRRNDRTGGQTPVRPER